MMSFLAIRPLLLGLLIVFITGGLRWTTVSQVSHPTSSDSLQPSLKSLMNELGQNMEKVNAGIWREDFRIISQGADGIANHPKVAPQELTVIKKALGEQIKVFVQFDNLVHQTAVEMRRVAAAQRMDTILVLYGQLQQGCVSCHSAFRSRVRRALNEANPDR